jgi:hypothetical protein
MTSGCRWEPETAICRKRGASAVAPTSTRGRTTRFCKHGIVAQYALRRGRQSPPDVRKPSRREARTACDPLGLRRSSLSMISSGESVRSKAPVGSTSHLMIRASSRCHGNTLAGISRAGSEISPCQVTPVFFKDNHHTRDDRAEPREGSEIAYPNNSSRPQHLLAYLEFLSPERSVSPICACASDCCCCDLSGRRAVPACPMVPQLVPRARAVHRARRCKPRIW